MAAESLNLIEQADDQLLTRLLQDAFHRILVHYGYWLAQVEHQLGTEQALKLETKVWEASWKNQMERLSQAFGFAMEDDLPAALKALPREGKLDTLQKLAVNWLANDGIWFQAVENDFGMFDAKRANDTCWTRFSPFEAARIKGLLGLPENGGLPALRRALGFRLYAVINQQSIEELGEDGFIFRMNKCRVQTARQRRGLPDYACKSAGMVEYPYFARAIDPRIKTECLGCPPDEHPKDWFCAWKFTLART